MSKSRTKYRDLQLLADDMGIPVSEVSKAVGSFFTVIASEARKLPFNNIYKVFKKDAFDAYAKVTVIPYIGRTGPIYSRYRKWRTNIAKGISQEPRSKFVSKYSEEDLEAFAGAVLSGENPTPIKRRRNTELYNRVWLVSPEGKRLARQVIPKNKKDV